MRAYHPPDHRRGDRGAPVARAASVTSRAARIAAESAFDHCRWGSIGDGLRRPMHLARDWSNSSFAMGDRDKPNADAYHCRGRARRGRGCEGPWAHDLQFISLGEVLSALAAGLAGKPPDSHRSMGCESARELSAIRGISRRAGPNGHMPGINLRMSNLIPRSHSV
jgi:hypothetical protein